MNHETAPPPPTIKYPYLREFDRERDYPMVRAWWEGHGFPPVPLAFLPQLGVIAHTGTDLAAAWLYMDNSCGVSMLEWLVTNPASSGRDSLRAIQAITQHLQTMATEFGYTVMLTAAKQPSLCRVHEKNGFLKTDEGMTHFVKRLND